MGRMTPLTEPSLTTNTVAWSSYLSWEALNAKTNGTGVLSGPDYIIIDTTLNDF